MAIDLSYQSDSDRFFRAVGFESSKLEDGREAWVKSIDSGHYIQIGNERGGLPRFDAPCSLRLFANDWPLPLASIEFQTPRQAADFDRADLVRMVQGVLAKPTVGQCWGGDLPSGDYLMEQEVLVTGWTRIPEWKKELAKVAGSTCGSFVFIERSWERGNSRRRRRTEMKMFGAAEDVRRGAAMFSWLEELLASLHDTRPLSLTKKSWNGRFAAAARRSHDRWSVREPTLSRSAAIRTLRAEKEATRLNGRMAPTRSSAGPSKSELKQGRK